MTTEGECHIRETFLRLDSGKQRRILDAAMDEFARRGYADASTNRIAEAARISKGMLFHYFGTKRDLFLYLVDYGIEVVEREYLCRVNQGEAELIERLQLAAKVKMKAVAENPHVFRFLSTLHLDDTVSLPGDLGRRLEKLPTTWSARLYGDVDTTMYRDDVSPEHVCKIIRWSIEGYQQELMDSMDRDAVVSEDVAHYWEDFDSFLATLRRILYRQEEGTHGDSHN